MTPALHTRDLVVGHRKAPVLSAIDIAVAAGELVSVLGVNGAGKSTLLRTLARSLPPISGSVLIRGDDIARLSPGDLARQVGVLLTERLSLGVMPAQRLVEMGRYPHTGWSGLLSDQDRAAVTKAIAAVGAQHLAQRDVNELSDGERQRIMIARALAQEPAVLLLDEPSAFLDVSARVEMMAMLRRLARDENIAIILSSHDLDLSLRSSDTIWLLDGKGTLQVGAPEDLLAEGLISAAFSSSTIAFSGSDRTFHIRSQPRGTAFVSGSADGVALARTVLEREGFAITDMPDGATLHVTVAPTGWNARVRGTARTGATYAELAKFIRANAF